MSTFLSGNGGQSTQQPAGPQIQSIPPLDGTEAGLNATVSALVNAVHILRDQVNPTSNSHASSSSKSGGSGGLKTNKEPKIGTFVEVSRRTKEVTVKDDVSGATLTYTQITQLILQDTHTGEFWKWNL